MSNFRTFVNRTGVVYNATKTDTLFAEDMNAVDNAVLALETLTSKYDFAIEFMSGVLTLDFYAPYQFKINSVTNLLNSPTTTILVAGASYTLGTNITAGSKITVTVSTASVIRLNGTK